MPTADHERKDPASPAAPRRTTRGPGGSIAIRRAEVETPEQVVLGFELADLGSRFLALLIDGSLLLLVLSGIAAAAWWLLRVLDVPPLLSSAGTSLLVLAFFAVGWGYFFWFEAFRRGRTPGKRLVGIRVVHDGGRPLTVRGAAVRNLVRVIDVQPFFTCLLGGGAMMLHPRTKRLGDLAAGTLVVRDRSEARPPEEERIVLDPVGPPRLSDAAFHALDRFLARRDGLDRDVRDRLAAELLARLEGRTRLVPPTVGESAPRMERLEALHADEGRRRRGRVGSEGGLRQAALLVRAHDGLWDEYADLTEAARRGGLGSLREEDVSRFASLYRLVASDLARVRTYGASEELAYRLERMVTEGHNLFYRQHQPSWRRLAGWLAGGFPALVRRRRGTLALAATALFLPGIVTWSAVRTDPALARLLVPAAMVERAERAPEGLARGEGYVDPPGVFMPVMSSGLIANNVRVTLLVFAGGILAGVGSLLILALNGVHLGAVVGLYDVNGASSLLWTFVAPHGVVELSAICVAGAAGLWLGSAVVVPGRRTRRDALVERAREAVSLLVGTTVLLVLAGLVEGFVSPAPIPAAVKLSVAALLAAALVAYLALAGRAGRSAAQASGTTGGKGSPPGAVRSGLGTSRRGIG